MSRTQHSETKPAGATAGSEEQPGSADRDTLKLILRGYVCDPEDGPAWRAAYEAGVDMSLLEDALRMSPAARLREHRRALNQILALIQARHS